MKPLLQIVLVCLFLLQTGADARTLKSPQVLFILDGSGSMWGRVDEKIKIVIARKEMIALINSLPESVKSGLQIYGHRRKGDCNDIQLAIPLSKNNKKELIQAINSIKPLGKTPISQSLIVAADHLKQYSGKKDIVLITDGVDTCSSDPCAVAKAIRDKDLNVYIHVVGFDISKKDADALSCIAKEGKGKFYTADTIEKLKEALTGIKADVGISTPPAIKKNPQASTDEQCAGAFERDLLQNYRKYKGLRKHKAAAFAKQKDGCYLWGIGFGYNNELAAKNTAMKECKRLNKKYQLTARCRIYIVNQYVTSDYFRRALSEARKPKK